MTARHQRLLVLLVLLAEMGSQGGREIRGNLDSQAETARTAGMATQVNHIIFIIAFSFNYLSKTLSSDCMICMSQYRYRLFFHRVDWSARYDRFIWGSRIFWSHWGYW